MSRAFVVRRTFLIVLALVAVAGCSTMALYDQTAYQAATALKVDALAIVDKATEPYPTHEKDITDLLTRVEKAYEYDKGREHDEITTKLWEKLKDPASNLLGGFLQRWKTETHLNATFIADEKKIISDGFDNIIQLESGKRKPSDIK